MNWATAAAVRSSYDIVSQMMASIAISLSSLASAGFCGKGMMLFMAAPFPFHFFIDEGGYH